MTALNFGDIVLGGNVFGWTADKAESFRLLDAFVDAGGASIDTADVYSAWVPGNSGGESETIIGEWFASRGNRERVVLGTKVFQHPARRGLAPENVRGAVEDSLRRLQTDHIDLYYAHRDDENVPQVEYLAAFDELVTAGKVREIGASGFSAERLRSAASIASENGLTPFTVSQDLYNLVERGLETEVLPAVADLGLVELPFYALASGFLTGKYRPGAEVDSARAGSAAAYLQDERNVTLLSVLDGVAAAHGVGVSAVSLAWLRSRPAVAAPIASGRTVEQLEGLFSSIGLRLTSEEAAALEEASAHRVA